MGVETKGKLRAYNGQTDVGDAKGGACVDERELEQRLGQFMSRDFSAETGAFRDALLQRCLDVLDAGSEGAEIDDADLDLLAAAGNPYANFPIFDDSDGRPRA